MSQYEILVLIVYGPIRDFGTHFLWANTRFWYSMLMDQYEILVLIAYGPIQDFGTHCL